MNRLIAVNLLLGTASADNSKYFQYPGWKDVDSWKDPNADYKKVNTVADCAAYPEKDRKAKGWVYVEPTEAHDVTLIHLHGTGGKAVDYPGKDEFLNTVPGAGHTYDASHRVVLPQAELHLLSARPIMPIPIWINFYASHQKLVKPALWAKMKATNDFGGRAVYLSSYFQQSTLRKAANFVFKTINEEVCKIARKTGKVDYSKIYLGGESMGSIVTAYSLMKSHEYLTNPIGGYYGFIGVVPTPFVEVDKIKTGPNSKFPAATLGQMAWLQRNNARFMWGAADNYFPDQVASKSYEPLIVAFQPSNKLETEVMPGQGHYTKNYDWKQLKKWLNCVKQNCKGHSVADHIHTLTPNEVKGYIKMPDVQTCLNSHAGNTLETAKCITAAATQKAQAALEIQEDTQIDAEFEQAWGSDDL